ncbi:MULTISPECIES: DUF6397 family protein [unclassified Streptomyces]|uniref:DUF6397 family protein n=1 Tax=unclassified Streptomyces TaxID=2593676 RepID=UPI00224D6FD7|nr:MULTISPECIES: DUF6397 family protein [unclassified Streptomyces]MCX4992637.1 DUF6397 family protein [Streptomyces sp. NBC_00568]MCX5002125.1 DUF6397 family protein [Streptomyces sp. NBC_00638]
MSGSTVTQSATSSLSRAARELELRRGEFDLALHLGCVRSVPDEGGGGRRVARAEIDRVRAEDGFPEALRERVKTVGTTEGAALMGITTTRFTRLARLGLVVPVNFYVNRYRMVVWLYLAEELRQFAVDQQNAPLMTGRTPEGLRDQLEEGLDLRPRNWRGRHLGFLLRQTGDPWARAAVVASLLDPVEVAEIVQDPRERAHLDSLRPERVSQAAPESPAARIAERIATADDPDEINWLRADLAQSLSEARQDRPAPRPTPTASPVVDPAPADPPSMVPRSAAPPSPISAPHASRPRLPAADGRRTTPESPRTRGLLGWFRRGKPDACPPTAL